MRRFGRDLDVRRHRVLLLLLILLTGGGAHGATITIGTVDGAPSLAEAVRRARDGDTILVPSGEYRGDVAVLHQRSLTIRGVGSRPVLVADGKLAESKAILVVRNGDIVIENIAFRGARVPDGNGAGIRLEKGRLRVRSCAFFDNEMGLLTSNFPDAELIVEDSEFAQAPPSNGGLHHLLYAGRIASLKVSGSRFHQGNVGHLLKSRARRTELTYNMLVDGSDGRASYEVDLPNGGDALLIGNVIGQSARTQNPVVIAFGAEGRPWPRSRLQMAHNTLMSDGSGPAWFLRVWKDRLPQDTRIRAVNNLSVGSGVLAPGALGDFRGNRSATRAMLEDADNLVFALKADSPLRGLGVDPRTAVDEDLSPAAEFTLPVGTRPLSKREAWSPGAFQR